MKNINELKNIYKNLKQEKIDKMPKYLDFMQKYFPEKLLDPKIRVKQKYFSDIDISEKDLNEFISLLEHEEDAINYHNPSTLSFINAYKFKWKDKCDRKVPQDAIDWLYDFSNLLSIIDLLHVVIDKPKNVMPISQNTYLDSKVLSFNNEDIVITDPCYLCTDNIWECSQCGEDFSIFGITNFASKSTLYGDWSCSVISNNEKIGEFCADAGMVCVMSFNDAKKLFPNIEEKIKKCNWCYAIIKNFTGQVQIKIDYIPEHRNFVCYVEGTGSINFKSIQSGF